MRKHPTDRLLWAIVAVGLFAAAAFVNPVPNSVYGYGDLSLFGHYRDVVVGGHQNWRNLAVTAVFTLIVAIPALAVGWLIQAGAVRCGLRLSGRTDPALADDYGDEPPAG